MAESERITNPSMGSNELGSETPEQRGSGISGGTDTLLHMAALSAQKKKEEDEKNKNSLSSHNLENINDDEKVVKNVNGENEFLENGQTDEG
ncbi:MAG: hypothetical protein ABI266_09690 [Ginsengibacter sp.]